MGAGQSRRTDATIQAPRTCITYDVAAGDTVKTVELPFVVGVLADLSGTPEMPLPKVKDRKFVSIDEDNFGEVMRKIQPRLAFHVDNTLVGDDTELVVELRFDGRGGIEQFEPTQVAMQIEPLSKLLDTRRRVASLQARMDGNDDLKESLDKILRDHELATTLASEARQLLFDAGARRLLWDEAEPREGLATDTRSGAEVIRPEGQEQKPLLDRIIDESGIGWDEWEREGARREIATLVDVLARGSVFLGSVFVERTVDRTMSAFIGNIDAVVSRQLSQVLHHPDFQKLEAAWRGLHYLVEQSNGSPRIRIRVMNISKDDLRKDLENAAEFDMSGLFQKAHEEYDFLGGSPYGMLVGDYHFSHRPLDVELLGRISDVAAAADAPFIAGADSRLVGRDDFAEFTFPRDLRKVFDAPEYLRWNRWRGTAAARYVGLVLPRVLLREPYRPEGMPAGTFAFNEDLGESDHTKYLWGNAAYALAVRSVQAFHRDGWCAAIRGYETGGLVTGLPKHIFESEAGDTIVKCPTETAISDRRCRELTELGLIVLCYEKHSDRAVFFSTPSCAKPAVFFTDQSTANSRLAARVEYVMVLSRFAHYFKAMMRDRTEGFATPQACEKFFSEWIARYVGAEASPSDEDAARRPLSSARLEVSAVWGDPEVYRIKAYLQPRFRLREPSVPLELTVDLPKPRG